MKLQPNDKYPLGSRSPNCSCGIFWRLGCFVRVVGVERAIFVKARRVSSANAERKLRKQEYLAEYAS